MLHGYALAYREYSTRYVAEEDEATTLKRGMCAGTFVAPGDWRHQHWRTISHDHQSGMDYWKCDRSRYDDIYLLFSL